MARDRSPISQRLKSLAQRAGLPGQDDEQPADAAHGAPVTPPAPPAASTPPDEQPTGDVPVVAEQPTDDQPAVAPPAEQPTISSQAIPAPEHDAPEPTALAHDNGPTLTPPVLPAKPDPEPVADADAPAASFASDQPADDPSPAPQPDQPGDEDDEPFSPRTTIWPQSTPTPRFEPQADDVSAPSEPTFPEPVPEPEPEPEPTPEPEPAAEPARDPYAPTPTASVIEPTDEDVGDGHTVESDALAPAAVPGPAGAAKAKVLGGLRRLRSPRGGGDAHTERTAEPATTATPESAAAEPTGTHEAPPAPAQPAIMPSAQEPPTKPSFGERAALRRRAKSLRARRDAGLLELGAIVLDQRRFGDPTGGSLQRRRTDELADIDSELAAIEQVLDDDGPAETVAQLGVVRCLSCTALLGPRDRFCVQCGAPRPEDAAPASAK